MLIHQLAERLKHKTRSISIEEKAILFQQLLEKRRKHFAAKRAKGKRNKPPTKAQQRKITCTYLKNMEGYKLQDLKFKEVGGRQRKESKNIADTIECKEPKVENDKGNIQRLKIVFVIIQDEEE
ncbi:hypothetical protein Tco_0896350 [Tanacetum coccineum]